MKLLVLGGTRFVGRAVVADALERGAEITIVSRGNSGQPPTGVTWRQADRTDDAAMRAALTGEEWDAVIDTWSGDADAVARSADLLSGSVGWYGFVSSRSVYQWPMRIGADESAPMVDVTPDGGYAAAKRGSELAVLEQFEGRCVLARAGLILGPYENAGRLTWWLARAAAGGPMVAPAPPERVWQQVDARDLAGFLLSCADGGTSGVFNVVSPVADGTTTRRLLESCVEVTGRRARLVWTPPPVLDRAAISPWDDLPGWVPAEGEYAGLHDCDVGAAVAAGLSCRPIEQTVVDTWQWLRTLGPADRPEISGGLPRRGLTAEQEQAVWWLLGAAGVT